MAQKLIIKQSRKENPFSIPIVDKTHIQNPISKFESQ